MKLLPRSQNHCYAPDLPWKITNITVMV